MGRGIALQLGVVLGLSTAIGTASCGEDELSRLLPIIQVTPERIDLGPTPVGVLKKHHLEVANTGSGVLSIESIAFVEEDGVPRSIDLALSLDDELPRQLEPSERLELEVHHIPRDEISDLGIVRVRSNDPARQKIDVPLTQELEGAPHVRAVPDVAQADIEADTAGGVRNTVGAIELGIVPVGVRRAQELFIVNVGDGNVPLSVRSIALGDPSAGLELETTPEPGARPVLLPLIGSKSRAAVTRSIRVGLAWQPSTSGARLSSALRIVTNDADLPELVIPIAGTAPGDPPPVDPPPDPPPAMCVPQTPDPGEPQNDACATAIDRGAMTLFANNTEHISWSDAMLYGQQDSDWTRIVLNVDAGCLLVGYDVGASVTLPAGEEGEVCVRIGDCTTPARTQCGATSARVLLFPGDSTCEQYNNRLPIYVQVRQVRGSPTCRPYTVSFDAR